MPEQTILCPNCKKVIPLTEALSAHLKSEIRAEFEAGNKEKIAQMRAEILASAAKETEEKFSKELKDLKAQNEEKEKKLAEMAEMELALRKERRELEEQKRQAALELDRKLDQERAKIREKTTQEIFEQQRLRDKEKEKMIEDLKNALAEAQRKAQQGSQQLQGEVLELDLEETLKKAFPSDAIEPIGKGVRGADVRQIVKSPRGTICGVILWESKRTKDWADSWIAKLKGDLRAEKANLAALVTQALPPEAAGGIGLKDGVWVGNYNVILPLAMLLRKILLDVGYQKAIQQNSADKAGLIYSYVTSHEFAQQVEALIEVYKSMYDQIVRDKVIFEKNIKQREAHVGRVLLSAAGIYGSMQGLAGSSMPQIKGLEETLELEGPEQK